MTNKLPKEYANQRPRHMAKPKPVKTSKRFGVFYFLVAISVAVSIIGLTSALIYITADRRQIADNQYPAQVAISQIHIDTSTPFQPQTNTPHPSATPEPTRTQFPSVTPTYQEEGIIAVQNVVVQKVHETVIVLHTVIATAQSTPTPIPTIDYAAKYRALEYSGANRDNFIAWSVALVAVVLTVAIVLIVSARQVLGAFVSAWSAIVARLERKPEARQIEVNTPQIAEMIQRMQEIGLSQSKIQYVVRGYRGGAAYYDVKETLESEE